ncbi:MAG: hypothetical protein M3319_01225, partial [Actinomycetota bacterium]|nr:hypothetical protein [Actinomycetota bacterium]
MQGRTAAEEEVLILPEAIIDTGWIVKGSARVAFGVHGADHIGSKRFESLVQEFNRFFGGFGMDTQLIHDDPIMLDILMLIEIKRAGQLLKIYNVGQVRISETQDRKRTAYRDVRIGMNGYDLEINVRQLGHHYQMFNLFSHQRRSV